VQTLLTSSLDLRRKLADLGVRIETHQSGRGENDDLAVQQLSALFFNRLLNIPHAPQSRSHPGTREFVRQFSVWRPADKKLTRDIVKAFQFADRSARTAHKSQPGGIEFTTPVPPYIERAAALPAYLAKLNPNPYNATDRFAHFFGRQAQ
jgi:hypothetical protein